MKITSFASTIVIAATLLCVSGCSQSDSQTLVDISGVWRGVSDGAMITIDLGGEAKILDINGMEISVAVKSIDQDNHIITLDVDRDGQLMSWTLRQIFDEEGSFTLVMTLDNGVQDNLAFVRNL